MADGSDNASLNPDLCEDTDADTCDDCANGTDGFGPLPDNDPSNDGTDTDGDGTCDAGDGCPFNPNRTEPGCQQFSDDFKRPNSTDLGPDWNADARVYCVLRRSGPTGAHYETGFIDSIAGLYWATNNGLTLNLNQFAVPYSIAPGDWLGATVEGTGTDSVVRLWIWTTDPDMGGVVDVDANWGPASETFTNDPATPVDTGEFVGWGTEHTTGVPEEFDNWHGGDR